MLFLHLTGQTETKTRMRPEESKNSALCVANDAYYCAPLVLCPMRQIGARATRLGIEMLNANAPPSRHPKALGKASSDGTYRTLES